MIRLIALIGATMIGAGAFNTRGLADERSAEVSFRREAGKVVISIGNRPVATYVYVDSKVPRPYITHVHTPDGTQVTRNFPPIEGRDRTDHATMHPGIWLAFGDLNGTDIWRNQGRVVHESFVGEPTSGPGRDGFTVLNRWETAQGDLICQELCRRSLIVREYGYFLLWDSTFSAEKDF